MRNIQGLDSTQIDHAKMCWEFISQETNDESQTVDLDVFKNFKVDFDVSEAHKPGSKTAYLENKNMIRLGADAYPGYSMVNSANSIMSLLACLCHELSHAQRYHMGFRRPFTELDKNLDEAETSIHASYMPVLEQTDRKHLIEDAMQRLEIWNTGELL
jgi:hypothetical protein